MRFHNVDLHVAVIEDVNDFFTGLGHQININNLSGHSWALGRPMMPSYGPIRADGWKHDIRRPWTSLRLWLTARGFAGYAGGITTYAPSLALAYQWLRRPLISVLCIRYEIPFSSSPMEWEALTRLLVKRNSRGLAHFVANNSYDAAYFEYFTGIRPTLIPSVCAYVDQHVSSAWSPGRSEVLVFGEAETGRACASRLPNAHFIRDRFTRYAYDDVARVRAHVIIPYNASAMSFFEHFWLGVPQFAPTPRFLLQLQRDGRALSQLTGEGFGPSPVGRRGGTLPDPNDGRNVEAWLPLHDIYTFPFVTLFDSFEELTRLLDSVDGPSVSARMRAFNERRRMEARSRWAQVIEGTAPLPEGREDERAEPRAARDHGAAVASGPRTSGGTPRSFRLRSSAVIPRVG